MLLGIFLRHLTYSKTNPSLYCLITSYVLIKMIQGCQIDNKGSPPSVYKIGAYDQVNFEVDSNRNVVFVYSGGNNDR